MALSVQAAPIISRIGCNPFYSPMLYPHIGTYSIQHVEMAVRRLGCYFVVLGVPVVLCFCTVIYSGRLTVRYSLVSTHQQLHFTVPHSSPGIPNPFHLLNEAQVSVLFLPRVTFLFVVLYNTIAAHFVCDGASVV